MSDEYIEKEDAIQSIIAHDLVGGDARDWAEYLLENTSTADVAPVRHGRWKHERLPSTSGGSYAVVRCSACEYQYPMAETRYCPNCGARMDGDADD